MDIILVKLGEIALKGLNRRSFEDVLIKNIRRRLSPLGNFEIRSSQSTLYVIPKEEGFELDDAAERVGRVFGIVAYSRARMAEKKMESILPAAADYLKEELRAVSTFKVEARRSDKSFPLKSPEICAEAGAYLLEKFPHLRVDVHNPDLTVTVEVRDFAAFVHGDSIHGAGGIPVGTGGKAAVLISGGIDSPVASWMMAKRGIELTAVHFASPPYTSERAEEKVVELLTKVAQYSGRMNLFVVPFTRIQEEIRDRCPEELFTILMRRIMMLLAERIARKEECTALITGESLGQVASQTIHAIACTDNACSMPVFRPLIGMDKEEIITISRKIDTFEISIQPYEDCCTVFTPKHPRTRPILKYVLEAQSRLPLDELLDEAEKGVRLIKIKP